MIPQKAAPYLFGLIVSGIMSLLVTSVATLRTAGMADNFMSLWVGSWLPSWAVAFPIIVLISPYVRRFLARHTREG